MKNQWKVCEPLKKAPKGNENFNSDYRTWNETKKE
jgi:hypothetical protein